MPSSAEPTPRELPERSVHFQGSKVAALALKALGWELCFNGLPGRQGVLVIYPHTSNWDFIIGILAKWAIGIPAVLWGKDSLFRIPLFGRFLRAQGGVPVVRHTPQGAVEQMIEQMKNACATGSYMWLALAPEGTRRRTAGWRSGFYRVAVACGVPVGLVFLDFGRKRVGMDSFWQLSGRPAADMQLMASRLAGVQGLRPQAAAPVTWLGA